MKNYKDILLSPGSTIREALKIIDSGAIKIGVDMNNWTACYPYGSYDDQSIKMLKERGCKLALTTEVDIATTNKDTRFIMPRLDTNDIPKDSNANANEWYEKL